MTDFDNPGPLLPLSEAAARFGTSKARLSKLAKLGRLPVKRDARGRVYVHADDLARVEQARACYYDRINQRKESSR